MCGICGIVWTDPVRAVDRQLVQRMNDALAHRGPDAEGFFIAGNTALAARRLKIIDLATGDQPMANEGQSIWIVFNGEIYNYRALRDELSARGHTFRTQSDTETIVHAYETWGADCVTRLRGMFAFALYDRRPQTDDRGGLRLALSGAEGSAVGGRLMLARDRLGKKPLYYYHDAERFVFGSELKALLQDRTIPRALDPRAIDEYLTYGYISSTRTGFQNIHKLPPAHWLIWRGGTIETRAYWTPTFAPIQNRSEEEWRALLADKLRESVRIRLMSEVPLGAFLSGGIDSSVVVALMSEASAERVKTFSIHFEDQGFSEIEYARAVAQRYSTDHHEFTVRPDPRDVLPKLARQFDEPFADSSAIPTYYVSKMAREHVTVALSGDGGDEIFGGYQAYRAALAAERKPRLRDLARAASRVLPEGALGKNYLAWQGMGAREKFLSGNWIFAPAHKRALYADALADTGAPALQATRFDAGDADLLTRMQAVDLQTYLPGDILAKVDRASMLCSLETRAPLLDHELVELVGTMPATLKFKGAVQKYILKRVAAPLLPPQILTRGKKGFSVPLARWLRDELRDTLTDILLDPRTQQRGLFQSRAVQTLLDEHQRTRRDHSRRLWAVLMLELWQRNCLDG